MSDPVTLTVVMRPAHGGDPPARGLVSGDVAEHAPDPDAAREVQAWFQREGFEVAPMVGTAFTITAPAEHVRTVLKEVPRAGEVPLGTLPDELARHVSAVVAEPPLDFGPTCW